MNKRKLRAIKVIAKPKPEIQFLIEKYRRLLIRDIEKFGIGKDGKLTPETINYMAKGLAKSAIELRESFKNIRPILDIEPPPESFFTSRYGGFGICPPPKHIVFCDGV